MIGNVILGEATEQQSSPEEELIDNHPLLDPELDWEQSGTEAVVQNAEEDAVQNSQPERSRSRDSGRSRSRQRVATADPIPVEGPRPPLKTLLVNWCSQLVWCSLLLGVHEAV